MIEEIVKKHVMLSMSNGSVLEGFVYKVEGNYVELCEIDNKTVIVNLNDISFARLGISDTSRMPVENQEPFAYNEVKDQVRRGEWQPAKGDFSMMAPSSENTDASGAYKKPQFVRSTRRDDIE